MMVEERSLMVTIPMKTRLNPDGTLDIHVATDLPESEVEVLVVVRPIADPPARWPAGFFTETYGAFTASPLVRPPQDQFEYREPLS
jgi:hypothetical protein